MCQIGEGANKMKNIKYHQNGVGYEYGADHTLTDNWNPDVDYGNEYVNVYFRIDTPSYDYNCGFLQMMIVRNGMRKSVNL